MTALKKIPPNNPPMQTAIEIPLFPDKYNNVIPGGYYIKARKIEESEIAHAAPVIRELWDWLLRQCNHKDNPALGIKRGQCVRRISDMQDALHWHVGYRKETYTKSQCEGALEYLRKKQMITTTKTTRGLLITVCKYDYYNNPENYEDNNEGNKKPTRRQQDPSTINKNGNNGKNDKNKKRVPAPFFWEEIKSHSEHELIEKYRALVGYLHGDNDEDIVFDNVLALEEQLTFNQYLKLRDKWKSTNVDLRDILRSMENNKKKIKDNKSVYMTMNGWANIRSERVDSKK